MSSLIRGGIPCHPRLLIVTHNAHYPSFGQTIGIYLVASTEAVSDVIYRDEDEKIIYFINKMLIGGEPTYSKQEKIELADCSFVL